MEQQGLQGPRIALLIDFDNVVLGVDDPPGFDAELVMDALRSRGVVVLGRAYGDWYRHNRHRRKLMEQGIELVETPAFGPVIKNSADIRIALDAFEIGMTQNHISEFCLVSGDSDFLPLIKKLQLLGKSVVVIAGNKFTSALIRQNCNEYISYENLLAESVGAKEDATTLDGAFALLQRTIVTMSERGQDARSSSVKQMMLQLNPVFSERSFGCHQFKQFLDKACGKGIIRLDHRENNSGEYHVVLPNDNSNGNTNEIQETRENAPKEKPLISDLETAPVSSEKKSSTRKSKVQTSDEPKESKEATLEEEIANNASTVPPARRGRLKFSGRTWRSGNTSVKTDETSEVTEEASDNKPVAEETVNEETVSEAAPAIEKQTEAEVTDSKKPSPKTEAVTKEAIVKEEDGKPDESKKAKVEEKPKTTTTRRRKTTTSSSKTTAAKAKDETPEEPKSEEEQEKAEPKKADAAKKAESEEKPAKKPAKKSTATKKAPAKATKKAAEAAEADGEEAPKKPVRRRRTVTKKTEEEAPKSEETPAE